jgi:hypothetical protein
MHTVKTRVQSLLHMSASWNTHATSVTQRYFGVCIVTNVSPKTARQGCYRLAGGQIPVPHIALLQTSLPCREELMQGAWTAGSHRVSDKCLTELSGTRFHSDITRGRVEVGVTFTWVMIKRSSL